MDHADEEDVQARRDALVEQLCSGGHIVSPLVEEAFRAVARHLFLPGEEPVDVYRDEAFVTKRGSEGLPVSSSSQPAIMAVMLEQLGLQRGQRVLEIGAGTGYNAALIAHVVGGEGAVTTIDIDADLVQEARAQLDAAGFAGVAVHCTDGALGYAGQAPYDRIILTVGAWDLAPAWLEQLAPDGRLVVPLSLRGEQRSVAFERAAGHLRGVAIRDCGFMRLRGAGAGPDSIRTLGEESGVFVHLDDERAIDTDALHTSLTEPGEDVGSDVAVTLSDVWGGLGLWLALHEPDIARLIAMGEAAATGLVPTLIAHPGQAATTAVLGERGLATLVGGA